jgi:hypothetical protein
MGMIYLENKTLIRHKKLKHGGALPLLVLKILLLDIFWCISELVIQASTLDPCVVEKHILDVMSPLSLCLVRRSNRAGS